MNSGPTSIRVQPDGSFEIPRVSPGSYVLNAFQPGGNGGRVDIEVGDRDLDSVKIAMFPGLTVFGRLRTPRRGGGGHPSADPPYRRGGHLRVVCHWPTALSQLKGTRIPGHFRGETTASAWSRSSRARHCNQDRPSVPQASEPELCKFDSFGRVGCVERRAPPPRQPEQELVIVHGGRAWVIEGRVLSLRQTPVAGATVVLIPQSGIRFHVDYKFTTSDASGRFRFQAMAPNDYKVFAWENIEYGAWQDPDIVAAHETFGTPVRMIDPGVQSIEVRAIPPER